MNQNSVVFALLLGVGLILLVSVVGLTSQQKTLLSMYDNLSQSISAIDQLSAPIGFDLMSNDNEVAAAESHVPGEILARFKPGVPDHARGRVLDRAGVTIKETIPNIDIHVLSVPENAERNVQQALAKNPRIDFAELNHVVKPSYTPNDPRLSDMWHHEKIRSTDAWSVASSTNAMIAILDTGIDTSHPDLMANIANGYNVVSNNDDIQDIHGHGTRVTGAASAVGDNSNQVVGVAYDTSILAIRISERDDGYASFSDIASGLNYAADNGARVASISYGACGSASVQSAADYLRSKDGLTFVASGNSGDDPGHAASESVICVSATNSSDSRPSWSSYGEYVDLSAPGSSILTTNLGGGTGSISGTSAATPVAAGLATLMWGANSSLSHSQVENILKDTATDLGEEGWNKYYGWGRIHAARAMTAAAEAETREKEEMDPPSASITHPDSGSTVSGDITINVSASSDDDLSVEKVEMYINDSHIGTDINAPYSFYWDTVLEENGDHTLQARVFDTAENSEWSETVTVTVENELDDTPPVVRITEPKDGANVRDRGSFEVVASASDDTGIAQIDILLDGVIHETCTNEDSCTAKFNANKLTSGQSYVIGAIAADGHENTAEDEITITVGGDTSDDDEEEEEDDGEDDSDDEEDDRRGRWCEPWPRCR